MGQAAPGMIMNGLGTIGKDGAGFAKAFSPSGSSGSGGGSSAPQIPNALPGAAPNPMQAAISGLTSSGQASQMHPVQTGAPTVNSLASQFAPKPNPMQQAISSIRGTMGQPTDEAMATSPMNYAMLSNPNLSI